VADIAFSRKNDKIAPKKTIDQLKTIGGRDIKKICRRYPIPTKLSPISHENLSDYRYLNPISD
jgi:hypothetical protein